MNPLGWLSNKGYELGNEKDRRKFEEKRNRCYCYNCNRDRRDDNGIPYVLSTFIVCPSCGNKRCPKSTDHRNECTNSNEPNQPSVYGNRY